MAKNQGYKPKVRDDDGLRGIGTAWVFVGRKMDSQDPSKHVYIKGFTIKRNLSNEDSFESPYMVILRARFGNRDLVKFRRINDLANLGHVLGDMLRKESDWRDDKWGGEGGLP